MCMSMFQNELPYGLFPDAMQVQGNSFQKKVTLLFGIRHAVEEKSNGPSQGGPRQRAEALAVLSNAFNSSSDMTSSMS
ncbi:villin-2-like [Arachis duranensis]|uniref:Villin-2-like n=1 Tax=Arachis duranensis TaxID=130453 RepID=A0A6P5MET4_ARADU|nr:villin-2-like [Arachis duranensis]